jgi:signal transduction histidine kinase
MDQPVSDSKLQKGAFFLKRNWQVIYAILLLLLVPTTIVLNTFFVINRFRSTVDVELQRTALLIGKMVNVTSQDIFADPVALQARLKDVAKVIPEVRSLDVLRKEGEDFMVVASVTDAAVGQPTHGTQYILSWYNDQAIAALTKSPRSAGDATPLTAEEVRNTDRFWSVVMPLHGPDGEKAYLLTAKISLSIIDDLIRENLFWSYLWLAITVLIVILVLSSNTRIFEYAILFRKLQEVDQMKDDFISMASHELRAPITAVRGYLSLFLEDAFGKMEEKPKGVLQTTFAIATHLAGLVEDLLDVSRIEQGRMSMNLEEVDMAPVIEEIVKQLHFEAEKKGLAFTYEKPATPLPMVKVDVARLKQVLINLCSNAIKYTPKGSVTVTTEVTPEKMLEIRVTDTGLGMSAEAQEKLFQKFYRVKTDETSLIPGTGLGLWITKKIVETMKGRIGVESIEKVGTQMNVMFPIVGKAPSTPAPTTDKAVVASETRRD